MRIVQIRFSRESLLRPVVLVAYLQVLLVFLVSTACFSQPLIGVNLSSVVDYSSQLVFTDLFRQSRPWMTRLADGGGPYDTAQPVPLGPGRFPKESPFDPPDALPQIPHTLMVRDIGGHYPSGKYALIVEGAGEVRVSFDAGSRIFSTPCRVDVPVSPTASGIALALTRSDAGNPVRRIQFRMPDASGDPSLFYEPFLRRLRPFGILRFMDMQRINNAKAISFANRTLPDDATQAGPNGVALELLADLAERQDASAWFCVPHAADDAYVRGMAGVLATHLAAGRTVYLEYSNELWNGRFDQAAYVVAMGQKLGLAADPFLAGIRYGVLRSMQIFKIFKEICGDRLRLVRVLAAQTANPWVAEQALLALDDPKTNPEGDTVDALAIGAYVGHDIADRIGASGAYRSLWPSEIAGMLEDELPALEATISTHKALCQPRKLRLLAYEGGQHLAVTTPALRANTELVDVLARTNADPSMGIVYRKLLDVWFRAGGDAFVAFAFIAPPGPHGAWGLLEWTDQPVAKAPKYQALLQYIASTPQRGRLAGDPRSAPDGEGARRQEAHGE